MRTAHNESAMVGKRRATFLLICLAAEAPETRKEIARVVTKLDAEGISLQVAVTAPEAVAAVITDSPEMILIDTAMPDESLFQLISALKAEEEAARIPIVLLTEDIAQEGIHFHLGSASSDNAALLDYLCEQLGHAVAAESSGKALRT